MSMFRSHFSNTDIAIQLIAVISSPYRRSSQMLMSGSDLSTMMGDTMTLFMNDK